MEGYLVPDEPQAPRLDGSRTVTGIVRWRSKDGLCYTAWSRSMPESLIYIPIESQHDELFGRFVEMNVGKDNHVREPVRIIEDLYETRVKKGVLELKVDFQHIGRDGQCEMFRNSYFGDVADPKNSIQPREGAWYTGWIIGFKQPGLSSHWRLAIDQICDGPFNQNPENESRRNGPQEDNQFSNNGFHRSTGRNEGFSRQEFERRFPEDYDRRRRGVNLSPSERSRRSVTPELQSPRGDYEDRVRTPSSRYPHHLASPDDRMGRNETRNSSERHRFDRQESPRSENRPTRRIHSPDFERHFDGHPDRSAQHQDSQARDSNNANHGFHRHSDHHQTVHPDRGVGPFYQSAPTAAPSKNEEKPYNPHARAQKLREKLMKENQIRPQLIPLYQAEADHRRATLSRLVTVLDYANSKPWIVELFRQADRFAYDELLKALEVVRGGTRTN